MVKKQKKQDSFPQWILYTAIIALFVYVVIILPAGTNLASITLLDEDGNEVETQSLIKANIREFSESVFNNRDALESVLLQSTISASAGKDLAVMKATIDNPFTTPARLVDATVKKNDVQVFVDKLGFDLSAGQSYDYATSQPVEMIGLDAQRNTVEIIFSFKSGEEVLEKSVLYQYYSVTPCENDLQCTGENNKCDIGNIAGFGGLQGDHYCVKDCVNNNQCPDGQLCKRGVCGY